MQKSFKHQKEIVQSGPKPGSSAPLSRAYLPSLRLLLSHGAVLSEGGQKQETPLHLCRRCLVRSIDAWPLGEKVLRLLRRPRGSAAQMYQSGMDWPLQRKWEECKAWSPSKDVLQQSRSPQTFALQQDMLQDSEDGALPQEFLFVSRCCKTVLQKVRLHCDSKLKLHNMGMANSQWELGVL